MKKIKTLSSILIPTTALIAVAPLASLNKSTSLKSNKKSTENSTGIFNLKDGVLYGFKDGVTQQDLLDNMKDNTLVLPECNEIAEGAFRDTILNDAPFGTTITIPASTTSIGDFAFYGNTATSVTWSGTPTCTTIGKSAFGRCKKLTSFTLPSTITTIKADAFMGCSTLATINCTALSSCPSLGNKSVFRGTKSSGSLTLTDANAESIWMNFVDSGLNSAWTQKNASGGTISKPKTIPTDYLTYSSVTDNEGNATLSITGVNTAICDISKFTKLSIPAKINNVNVTQIAASAFANKTSLTLIDLSSATNLTTINEKAFMGCTNVTSVTLSTSITTIGDYAFAPNAEEYPTVRASLTTVTVPSGSNLTTIGSYAFSSNNLSTFAMENTKVTTIGSRTFRNSKLTKVTFPSTLTDNINSVFPACTALQELDLSACTSLTKIPTYFANACTALTTVKLPSSISTIIGTAFTGDTALTTVIFANTSNSFIVTSGSTTINSIYFPTSTTINADYLRSGYQFVIHPIAFTYTNLNVDNQYASTFAIPYSSTSSSITWSSSNTSIATVSGGNVTVKQGVTGSTTITATITGTTSKSTCTVTAIAHCSNLTFTSLTSTTASVCENSSSRPTTGAAITVPAVWNSRFVTTTTTNSFTGSTAGSVSFPGTLTTLGTASFNENYNTSSITFQEPCKLTFAGNHMFNNCDYITSMSFPEGMVRMDNAFAFMNANRIVYVKLPSTIEYIYGWWFGNGIYWGPGDGSFVLDLTALSHVPTLNDYFGDTSKTTQKMTVKVKNAEMKAKFQATEKWNDSRITYTVG